METMRERWSWGERDRWMEMQRETVGGIETRRETVVARERQMDRDGGR